MIKSKIIDFICSFKLLPFKLLLLNVYYAGLFILDSLDVTTEKTMRDCRSFPLSSIILHQQILYEKVGNLGT